MASTERMPVIDKTTAPLQEPTSAGRTDRRALLKAATASALAASAIGAVASSAAARQATPAATPVAALLGAPGELTVYSGRSEDLIAGVIEIVEVTGEIDAQVSYGSTGEMAIKLLEEGENTPASLFVAQDAGALGQLANEGRLAPLPQAILDRVDPRFASPDGLWVWTLRPGPGAGVQHRPCDGGSASGFDARPHGRGVDRQGGLGAHECLVPVPCHGNADPDRRGRHPGLATGHDR